MPICDIWPVRFCKLSNLSIPVNHTKCVPHRELNNKLNLKDLSKSMTCSVALKASGLKEMFLAHSPSPAVFWKKVGFYDCSHEAILCVDDPS